MLDSPSDVRNAPRPAARLALRASTASVDHRALEDSNTSGTGGFPYQGFAAMDVILRSWRWSLATFALGLVGPAAPDPTWGADRPPTGTPVWVGTGSCAAAACHGGRREPLGLKGSEYTFSQAYDPHNRAYSVLFDDRSKLIEKNYRRMLDVEAARPFEDDACLRCHVHQGYDSKAPRARTAGFSPADGAGCEACHGPAGKWLVPHAEYGWKGLTDLQKSDIFGMRPTKDLLARGQTCTECHVGLGPADVNHDLIAAGHPRLNFEYGSQLAKLPKHWRAADDKARHPDYEAKVWALGQLLSAKAALDLLESRATRSLPENSTSPWPEFAEYSCFSCHHELVKGGWPSANASLAPRAGTLQWGTWYMPTARGLPPGLTGLDLDTPNSSLGSLRTLMTRPVPDAALVVHRARGASEEIARVADSLNRGSIAPAEVRAMLTSVLKPDASPLPLDWDRAARQYLAIVALDKAAGEYDPRYSDLPARLGLEGLLKDLDLPIRVDRRGGLYDSPYRFDPERIRGHLRSIQAALPTP